MIHTMIVRRLILSAFVAACAAIAVPALAQDAPGSITGRVLDPEGQPAMGAQVTVENAKDSSKDPLILMTNLTGDFAADGLAPGTWTVTVVQGKFFAQRKTRSSSPAARRSMPATSRCTSARAMRCERRATRRRPLSRSTTSGPRRSRSRSRRPTTRETLKLRRRDRRSNTDVAGLLPTAASAISASAIFTSTRRTIRPMPRRCT